MATDKNFIEFLSEQLFGLSEISFRPMMGEYLLYYRGKLIGDVCDNCLFVKPVSSAAALFDPPVYAPPYAGAKELLLVEDLDDKEFLKKLLNTMWEELPYPKPKKKK